MKKSVTVVILLVLTLVLWAGSAFAYTIDDDTDVYVGESWRDVGFIGQQDVIGEPIIFDTKGIDVSWSSGTIKVDLYTSYDGTNTFNGLIGLADLALDLNQDGNYEYGIDLWGGNPGLYDVSSWSTSYNFIEDQNSGAPRYFYGEGYDGITGIETPPVMVNGGIQVPNIDFIAGGYSSGSWSVSFDASEISDFADGFDLFWGTATCANDVIKGSVAPVPEPATMLLFSVGLIGMGGLGRKKFLKRGQS